MVVGESGAAGSVQKVTRPTRPGGERSRERHAYAARWVTPPTRLESWEVASYPQPFVVRGWAGCSSDCANRAAPSMFMRR